MNFSTNISKLISAIFHPLLMPSYGLLVIFNSGTYLSLFSLNAKLIMFLLVFAGTFVLPMIFMPIFMYKKYIKNIEMETKRERTLPLLLTLLSYYLTYYMMTQLLFFPFIVKFLFAATMSVALSLIVTFFWKISLHLIGVGGLLALIFSLALKFSNDFRLFLITIILIAGIVGFSRLFLKSHNPSQVYIGFASGFVLVFLLML